MESAALKNETLIAFLARPLIGQDYKNPVLVSSLRQKFQKNGYVKLPKFFTKEVFNAINVEVTNTFRASQRKDFTMSEYKTPRNLCVVSGEQILEASALLPVLYSSQELRESLSGIVGKKLNGVYHKHEFMVGNSLEKSGDTHGWHLDDPRYALIIILESPASGAGGDVEYISDWRELCREHNLHPIKDIHQGLKIAHEGKLQKTASHIAGDCYLLSAYNCLHRVTPLKKSCQKRRVLNMAFDDRTSISFGKTADKLYGMLSESEGIKCE